MTTGPSDLPAKPAPKRRRRRLLLRLFGFAILSLIFLVLGLVIYHRGIGAKRLAAAIANTDHSDPNWHYSDLISKRAVVPDAQNAALIVVDAGKLIPNEWPPSSSDSSPFREKSILEQVREVDANEQLSPELLARARAELHDPEAALPVAHKLLNYRTGRYPDLSFQDRHSKGVPDQIQACRQVGELLWLEAALLAQDAKIKEALEASRCQIVCGDSIGDEPDMIALLMRDGRTRNALTSIERTLAQGQAREEDLAALQQRLEQELAVDELLNALRGERAFGDQVWTWIDTNDPALLEGPVGNSLIALHRDHPWAVRGGHWFAAGFLNENHAVMLELASEAVEIAKRPVDEQGELFESLDRKSKMTHFNEGASEILIYRYAHGTLLMPAIIKVANAHLRLRAELRCTVAALASERYRLANGRWPQTLADLTPRFLDSVPLDPFDKKPLKVRRFDDGLLIYSISEDRKDQGGNVDRKNPSPY